MSVVRVGSSKQFADNWENIFGNSPKKSTAGNKVTAKKSPVKKATKKSGKKK